LQKLFARFKYGEDTYGFITNNLVVLAAFVYTSNEHLFNPFKSDDYLYYFRTLIFSKTPKDQETAVTCMYFFFKKKSTLFDYFVHNIDVLRQYLNCFKSTDTDLKKACVVALKELLKVKDEETKDKCNEVVRRVFGNITKPNNFPELGNEYESVAYLLGVTDVPFEDQEKLGLKVMKNLIKWEWGMRALYSHPKAVSYIVSRHHKSKEIVELKYKLVEKTIQSKLFLKSTGVMDPVIGEQLEVYYS